MEQENQKDKTNEIFRKIDTLLDEKIIRENQWRKKKKFWAIIINALEKHNILSQKDMQRIARLEIF